MVTFSILDLMSNKLEVNMENFFKLLANIFIIFMNMFAKVPDVGAQNDWKACWFE